NGFIVVRLRVSAFIATLGTATIIGAVQTIVANQTQPLQPNSTLWQNLTQYEDGGFQVVLFYLLATALVFWGLRDPTRMGRQLYAVGGTPGAARLSGINVAKWTWVSL